MKNVLGQVEKRLKSCLKHNKRIRYSKALALTFLLTGGFLSAEQAELAEDVNFVKVSENLNKRIKQLRLENKKKLKDSRLELERLEKEGDQVIKSPWESYIFSTFGGFKDTDKKDKVWKYGSRMDTEQDRMRNIMSGQQGAYTGQRGTTGWITETHTNKHGYSWANFSQNAWDGNTAIYDNTYMFSIMATVTPKQQPDIPVPNVNLPSLGGINAPSYNPISINVNEPSLIGSININQVNIGFVGVNPPLLGSIANVTSPKSVTVSGVDPNININVAAPGEVKMDVIVPPKIDVNPPVISVDPQTPPKIEPPVIVIPSPKTVQAPNFSNYIAPGGSWITGHGETIRGVNTFQSGVLVAYTTADYTLGTTANLASGQLRRLTDPAFPLFSEVSIQGGGAGRGTVYAYRTADGLTGKSGYSNVRINDAVTTYDPKYWSAAPGYGQDIAGSDNRTGYGVGAIVNAEIDQKNRWLMTIHKRGSSAPTVISNIDFILGGPDGIPGTPALPGEAAKTGEQGVLLMRNDGDVQFNNSSITLQGRTTINQNIVHYGNHYLTSLEFNNVTINIVGNENTLFTNVPVSDIGYWSTPEINSTYPNWGLPEKDNGIGAKGIFGKTDLDIDTRVNTVFFVQAAASRRWNGYNSVTNPGGLVVYTPLMGRIRYYNRDTANNKGTFNFNGSGNVGAWINKYTPDRAAYGYAGVGADETPIIDLGTVNMRGDGNVGVYFTQNNSRPDYNGIYQGKLPLDFKIGETLGKGGGTTQSDIGNTDSDKNTTTGNVALYVTSGQRKELTVTNGYFPATVNLVTHASTNTQGGGITPGTQLGYTDLNTAAHAIKDLTITDYSVIFGKYSKDNIAVVARNGSVVKIQPAGNITDGVAAGAADADRATGSIIAYAEGIWYNPRPVAINPNNGATGAGLVVTDGTPGQKYVANYGSEIHLLKPVFMGSKNAIPLYAKDGAKIVTQSITLYGPESIGSYADGRKFWAVSSLQASGAGTGGKPQTNVTVNGDITATNGNNNKGVISLSANKPANSETVTSTGDGSNVTVSGKITINGLGAYADGAASKITISGAGSLITSSPDGALVAKNGGKINFAGGTINHNHDDSLAFFAGEIGTNPTLSPLSNINFTGTTTINYSKGVVFYGKPSDYSSGVSTTARYGGMSNVKINITGHGVNLGVFEFTPAETITTWNGDNTSLMASLQTRVGGATITNSGGYWVKSSLDGGKFIINSDVNRDSVSAGSVSGDQFNDITMERVAFTLNAGKTISSNAGKGVLITSNSKAASNNETGYTIDGTIDVNGANGLGTFVNYGHTVVNSGGQILTENGVGVYGVNGSRVENKAGGLISVGTASTQENIGIIGLSEKKKIGAEADDNFGFKVNGALTAVNITNSGDLEVTGNKSMGIYADNNVASPNKAKVLVVNEGKIEVTGDETTGIYVNTGTITLKDSNNIIVGKDGKGVYGKNSDLAVGNTSITVGDNGVGLLFEGTTTVNPYGGAGKTLEVKLSSPATEKGTGIYFTGLNGETLTNNINIKAGIDGLGADDGSSVSGIYGTGKKVGAVQHMPTVINNGNILVGEGDKGIYGEYLNINNTGEIALQNKSVGIYTKNSNVTTASDKIKVNGDETIGAYVRWSGTLNFGTAASQVLAVNGKKSIGMYVGGYTRNIINGIPEDPYDPGSPSVKAPGARGINNAVITLANTTKTASANPYEDLKIGMYLNGGEEINSTQNNLNNTGAVINVGANNIGVYGVRSEFTNAGTINNKDTGSGNQNIGIYFTDAAAGVPALSGGDKFRVTNTGTIDVLGENNLGIFATINDISGRTDSSGVIYLDAGGIINVKPVNKGASPVNTPIGVYAKGSGITISTSTAAGNTFNVDEDGIGIYSDGANELTGYKGAYNLKSSMAGAQAVKSIGIFLKDGSVAKSGDITLNSVTGNDSSGNAIRPIGVYYSKPTTPGMLGTIEHGLNITDTGSGAGKSVIGLFITGVNDTDSIKNTGNITLGSNESLGAYVIDSVLSSTGIITANGNSSYGVYLTNSTAFAAQDSIFTNEYDPLKKGEIYAKADGSIGILIKGDTAVTKVPLGINKGTVESGVGLTSGIDAVGVYVENGKFINDKTAAYTGIIKSNLASTEPTPGTIIAGSIAVSSKDGEVLNKGDIVSEYVGIYSEDSKIEHQGNIDILSGTGIIGKRTTAPGADSTVVLDTDTVTGNSSKITGTANALTGVLALDGTKVTLKNSDISLTGNNTFGLLLTSMVPSALNKSSAELLKGDITVGSGGIAVYSVNGNLDIKNYDANSKFVLGNEGIGIYADTATVIDAGSGVKVLNMDYTSAANKGVGVYYEESTGTGNRVNNITVKNINTGLKENFVNILSNNTNLTNNADQVVGKSGIGIYGSGRGSIINNGTIFLNGETAVGLYAKGAGPLDIVTITKLGSIEEEASSLVDYKERIGAYIDTNANITGTDSYSFNVDGGIGMYLKSYIDYAGTMTVGGTTFNDGIDDHRTIGIYVDSSVNNLAKDLNANIKVTGEEGVGIYLAKTGMTGAAVKYTGTMDLLAVNPNGKYGIGIYLSEYSNLDFTGTINIGGATGVNNIGFYIENNAVSNLTAGTINTNNSGILAYIKEGTFNTSGSLVINGLTNIIVEGTTGTLTNGVNVEVGTTGLQGINGATVANLSAGKLWSTIDQALALSGSDGVKISNEGVIELKGENSVGIFTKDSTATLKNGSTIEVGKNGVGVYALLDNNAPDSVVKIDTGSSLIKIGEGATGIAFDKKGVSTGDLKLDFAGTVDIQGTGGENKGIYMKDTIVSGTVDGNIILSDNSTGIYTDSSNFTTNAYIKVGASTGTGTAVGIFADNGAAVTNTGTVETGEAGIAHFAGNGAVIDTSGTNIMADKSTIAMAGAGGTINYNNSGDVFVGDNEKKGFAADGGIVNLTGGKTVNVGNNNSVGIIIGSSGSVNNINSVNVGNASTGVYVKDNSNYNVYYNIFLNDQGAGGISGEGGLITLNSGIFILSAAGVNEAIGMINKGAGGIADNRGVIDFRAGTGNIGMYGSSTDNIQNNNQILIGESASTSTAVGMYGEAANNVLNYADITIGKAAIGMYGKNVTDGISGVDNYANITSTATNAIGMYGENSGVKNAGTVAMSLAGVGIYGKNSIIENTGTIITGDTIKTGLAEETAVGIYATGTSDVRNVSNINTGWSSVGIFGENGTIINDGTITAGESSIYMFTYGAGGNIINNSLLNLTDRSIGIYATAGTAVNSNTGVINVGKSDIMSDPREFAVGMATETGTVINRGTINVDKEYGVGMFAGKKDANTGKAYNEGTINVTGKNAYGIQVNEEAQAYNSGIINVSGNGAYGIAASKRSSVYNSGTMNISGTSMGVYLEDSSYFENSGTMVMDTTGQGVYLGTGSQFVNTLTGTLIINGISATEDQVKKTGATDFTNIGNIVFEGPNVQIHGVPITNIGNIVINGPLNIPAGTNVILNTVDTDNGMGAWKILDGVTGTGNIILSPGATQGNSKLVHNVQIMDFGTTAGDLSIVSQSVTWLADKWYDEENTRHVLRLTKIPYVELLANTEAMEFGRGLDYIYERQAAKELQMFDGIDTIMNKDELAETFDMQLRGNVYANIQQRMMDVDGAFDMAYRQLKSEENTTKDVTKVSAIYSGGNISDKNPGVEEYDYQSLGIMYLKEKETLKYGTNLNYSLGIMQTKFDFDQDSKEDVTSLKAGIGYEQYLTQGSRFKFMTRGELGVNYHDMERKMHLNTGTYKNNGDYFSGTAQIKNRLNYELPIISKTFKMDVYGSLNMGYGVYEGFKEDGDGIYLDVKSEDYFSIRPGVGIEGEIAYTTVKGNKFMVTAGAAYEYETQDIYDDGNRVKIADTPAGYYRLEKPEKIDNIVKANLGLGFETAHGFKTGVRVEREEGSVDGTKYQIDFSWKF